MISDEFLNTTTYSKLKIYLDGLVSKGKLTTKSANLVMSYYNYTFNNRLKFIERDVMFYLLINHPELLSLTDIIDSNQPILRFIYTNYVETEEYMDKVFKSCNLKIFKYKLKIDDVDIIVNIFNIPYAVTDDFSISHNEDYNRAREEGYAPLGLAKNLTIGVSWYNFTGIEEDIHNSMLFPITMLPLKRVGDGWSKEGWRNDVEMTFRSSWEANIARILNYKEIKWKYEAEYISLDLSNEIVSITPTYIPDFILSDNSIIEVKGFWDMRSKAKMKLVKEQYPDRKIIIIDVDLYHSIYRKYYQIIPNWEEDSVSTFNDTIQVVGITIPNRKPFVDALSVNDELILTRDVNNEFDCNAIKVTNQKGNHVGFIAKDWASILAPKIDMGFIYKVTVKEKQPKVIQCNAKLVNPEDIIVPEIFQ